jgi:hypothetical protein
MHQKISVVDTTVSVDAELCITIFSRPSEYQIFQR